MFASRTFLPFVQAAKNVCIDRCCGWLGGHLIVLVVQRDVEKNVFWFVSVHSMQTILNNCCNFVGKRWVVRLAGGNSASKQQAMTILVLKALAHKRGASGRCAKQKAASTRIGCLPDQVANTLETEHGIEGVKRNHWHAPRGVTRARRNEAGHAASLGDSFFKNLS